MNSENLEIKSRIESLFQDAISQLDTTSIHSDLFVRFDAESGELQIYNETEELVANGIIDQWIGKYVDNQAFEVELIALLRSVTTSLAARQAFDQPNISKPFSVSLVDDDFSIIEELLFLDDDTFRLDDPLLKDLDSDLDSFLNDLLADLD